MNWISKLLKKPAAKTSAPSIPAATKAAKPTEDAELLRGALATAADGARKPLAARLGRTLAQGSQAPRGDDPPEVWVAAICHAPDKALALAWVADLKGDAWLGEVATEARGAEIRHAAARRIETTAVLERVAHASRDKDKRVYRHCADLLRQRRQAEASARRATEIADELRGLLACAPLPHTRLLDLKKELSALGEAGEPITRCNALLEQALARLRQESEARRDLHASQSAAAAWPWGEYAEGWRARFASLSRDWTGLPSWLAGEAAARALGASLGEIESRLAALAMDDERVLACGQFLDPLAVGMPPDADTTAAWDALAKPHDAAAREPLETRWQALRASPPPAAASEPVPAPTPTPRPQTRIDQDAVRGLLDKLEEAIGQGHLVDADATLKQIKTTLAGNGPHGVLESRWHSLQAQLEALRGWARWGTAQARENLIAAAGELLKGESDVEELALAIPALREEWKRLNAHSAAAKGQWESFDAALEQAYRPVAALRAEQAARQAEAGAVKQALCAEWEAEVAGMVWEYADFKVVEARRADLLKQWRAAPQAGFRDERILRKRFDTLIGDLDRRLDAARTAEYERREQLIAAAEALNAQADLRQAMADAKALQGRWGQQALPVRLKRSDEQKLWRRFRAACDAVFARHDALRAEQTAQRQERALFRQVLLDAFAASLAGADANEIKRALAQFRADWDAAKPAAREPADSLETQARDLEQRAQRRLAELRQEKHLARFELLARKAALAARVEAAALAAEPLDAVVAEAKQAWDQLPPLPGNSESLLARRLAEASILSREQLAAGREAREALLLELEISLGLPSPKNFAEIRRERQLQQLQNRYGSAPARQSEPEEMLVRWYATAALPDPVMEHRIAAVVRQLAEHAVPPAASATPKRRAQAQDSGL
jgi:exonuclease SbcC